MTEIYIIWLVPTTKLSFFCGGEMPDIDTVSPGWTSDYGFFPLPSTLKL